MLRWVGLALAVAMMLAGGLNLIVAPWGVGGLGPRLGFQMISYLGSHDYLLEDFHPFAQYYLDEGAIILFGIGSVYAITAGLRSRWLRWLGVVLQLLCMGCFLLAAWGHVPEDRWLDDPAVSDWFHDGQVLVYWLRGLAVVPAVAALMLALRAHLLYDVIAVAMVVGLAVLHSWSVSLLSTVPPSDPPDRTDGVSLTFLAWTPGGWFLLAAVGALLAAIGASRRHAARRRAAASPSIPAPRAAGP
ncbi:MAG TPA: hypothetical protein VIL37_16530 [Natronosporangium sp.]